MNASHIQNRALKRIHRLTVKFETLELAKQLAIKTTPQPEKYVELLSREAQQVQERARQISQSIADVSHAGLKASDLKPQP